MTMSRQPWEIPITYNEPEEPPRRPEPEDEPEPAPAPRREDDVFGVDEDDEDFTDETEEV